MVILLLAACERGDPVESPPVGDGEDTAHADTDTADTGDSPPVDADADGSPKGVDCDDADATRFPGAADPCDGVDQDCDGLNAGAGSCSELFLVGEEDAHGWWGGDGDGGSLALRTSGDTSTPGRNADFDGDGTDDLVTDLNGALLLRGRLPWPDTPVTGSDYLGYWSASRLGVAGDFDGDGNVDLFATSPEDGAQELYEGAVYLVLGPPSRWPTTRASPTDVADAHWTHENGLEGFGNYADAADITGDGLSDVVVLSSRSSQARESDPGGYVHVLPGRTTGLPLGVPVTDGGPTFTTTFSAQGHELSLLPDIDGDGIAEMSFCVTQYDADSERVDTLALFPTDALTFDYSGQDVTELWAELPNGDAVRRVTPLQETSELGDADGDGYGDVALMMYENMSGVYLEEVVCMAVLRGGADLPGTTVSDQLAGRVCIPEHYADRSPDASYGLYAQRVVPDTDGDGVPDLFWAGAQEDSSAMDSRDIDCIIPTSQLPSSGALHIDEVRKFCFAPDDETSGEHDVKDLDGDGLPELLVSETRGGGRILVVPGFEIPWDDPTRW